MESKRGWIKLYRDITEHWVYQDPLLLKIWIDILLTANHEPKRIYHKSGAIEIQRGQLLTSVRRCSDRWKIDKTTVSRKLELLQNEGMIYVDAEPRKGTLITVCNYDDYQDFQEPKTDSLSDKKSDKKSDKSSDKARTKNRTKNRTEQEYIKNEEALKKNDKNIYGGLGLAPGDPDYVEEV